MSVASPGVTQVRGLTALSLLPSGDVTEHRVKLAKLTARSSLLFRQTRELTGASEDKPSSVKFRRRNAVDWDAVTEMAHRTAANRTTELRHHHD